MALHVGVTCPSLQGATEWIGDIVDTGDLIGHPFIIVFWSVSCSACLKHLPMLYNWQSAYEVSGLKVIAVHAPRTQSDLDVTRIRYFLQSQNLSISCAVDNELTLANEYETENIWPYYFLFGKSGKMKSRAASEAGLRLFEHSLRREMESATA